ncbi:FadR/GntR family transcriptional regulator [Citricoccus alkalitolerans]
MGVNSWTALLRPIEEAGVSEAIVRRLSELMCAGTLRAGDRLPSETELATYFQVAPMTVRGALKVLREEGFVETKRGRHAGTVVSPRIGEIVARIADTAPRLEVIAELTSWRKAISGECAALAAKYATEGEMVELGGLVHQADSQSPDYESYRFADARVHLYIAELSRSERLLNAERQIQAELSRLLGTKLHQPGLEEAPTQGHGPLLAAISVGDQELARRRLREHVQATLNLVRGTGLESGRHSRS